jgi:tRNA G37 N-methylase TrmD
MSTGPLNGCIVGWTNAKQVHALASHHHDRRSLVDRQKPGGLQGNVLSSELIHESSIAALKRNELENYVASTVPWMDDG